MTPLFQLHNALNIDMINEIDQMIIEATEMGKTGAVKTVSLNMEVTLNGRQGLSYKLQFRISIHPFKEDSSKTYSQVKRGRF